MARDRHATCRLRREGRREGGRAPTRPPLPPTLILCKLRRLSYPAITHALRSTPRCVASPPLFGPYLNNVREAFIKVEAERNLKLIHYPLLFREFSSFSKQTSLKWAPFPLFNSYSPYFRPPSRGSSLGSIVLPPPPSKGHQRLVGYAPDRQYHVVRFRGL